MKFDEAMDIIGQKSKIKRSRQGYRIRFEYLEEGVRRFEYFPELFEKAIKSEKRAKKLADKFSNKTGYKSISVTGSYTIR